VLRYRLANGKKDFRQRRPDGKGAWIYDLEGVRRILYRLPDLIDKPDAHVLIVEGEKDAERLNALFQASGANAVATTSAQGANDTGRWEAYRELLRGRACSVIPDSDPAGLKHAIGICGYLNGVAASVRMVELPDVGKKGDVSDWFDQGNSSDDLWKLILEAPAFDPSAIPLQMAADRDATAADLVAAKAGTRWLWPQWIPLGVLTLLTAEPSTGKTRLGLDLTKRIALGMDWPDGQPMDLGDRRPVVLWIPADNQHSELSDCPSLFGFPPETIILNTSVGNLYGGTELQEPEQLKDLYERIVRQHPAMVIIDTITNTSDAKSQDTSDAKRQYKPLQDIAKRTGAAIVCVTHTNLAGKSLGRRADEKTRVTIRIECPDPDGQPNRRKLSVALTRLSSLPPALGVTMGDQGNTYDGNPPVAPAFEAAKPPSKKTPGASTQRAIGFVVAKLRDGPMKLHVLRGECDRQQPPIAAKQLYEARDYLGIEEFEKQSPGSTKDHKWWQLPAGIQEQDPNRPVF
jgi:5S rRNA maturation endonuclease (ribonuclease M5)